MKKITIPVLIILIISCTNLSYKSARKTYKSKKYSQAIKKLNYYIKTGGNPALRVKSQYYRSQCYYILGKKYMEEKNYSKAADYLFLANSTHADTLLDNCYYEIAQDLINNKEFSKALKYYNFIIEHISNSNLMPEILYSIVKIEYEVTNNPDKSYLYYQTLCKEFPQSEPCIEAKTIVNQYMPFFIEDVNILWKQNKFSKVIDKLLIYLKYPADYKKDIELLIGKIYFSWGEYLLANLDLDEIKKKFIKAKNYNPNLSDKVQEKYTQICEIYINQGDEYLNERNTLKAIEYYKSAFNFIDDYKIAQDKIKNAEKIAADIKKAEELVQKGDKFFDNKEYQKALTEYTKAYDFDKIKQIKEKINTSSVWIRITNDPQDYAKEIVQYHKKSKLTKKINDIVDKEIDKFSRNDVKVTPWQVLRSAGKNKYEVRYTILTPENNYFFRWLVKLETGEIIPLNKTSEDLMK